MSRNAVYSFMARIAAFVLVLNTVTIAYGKDSAQFPEWLVSPASSPLTKIQLIATGADKRPLFLTPQTTGFVVEGGYVVTVAHMFPSNLIARLQKGGDLTAYIKFPMFEPNFFNIDTARYPEDIFYVDESKSPFRNHTYFVKLTPVAQNPEQDHTIWMFNKDLAGRLPALKLAASRNLDMDKAYYMLQSANPANSTGYLLNKLTLNGVMFQHLPQDIRVEYAPVNGQMMGAEAGGNQPAPNLAENGVISLESAGVGSGIRMVTPVCMMGKRYLFDGYFKFGSSGAPVLNDRFEVVGVQSEALFTQYKYNDLAPNGKVFENQGLIFNRCAVVPADFIAATIEKSGNKR